MVKAKAGRGKSWCPSSVDLLLDITVVSRTNRKRLPNISAPEAIAQCLPHRDVEALKRNFLLLKNVQKPTGHPYCPPTSCVQNVCKAKSRALWRSCRWMQPFRWMINLKTATTVASATLPSHLPTQLDHQHVEDGRTVFQPSEIQALSDKLKHKQPDTGCLLSYTAKKRRSIGKYIERASESDAKALFDTMTFLMVMSERDAKREERR
ncbi:hypothetical protein H257_18384 [Aphanomyces astaci]|uniref:Uncharacterized protein n=1 Tax=Aphanomyces astaci TaxID=112090 RepID=W4FBB0_APHAT|nr:hypothetical protein H257_18384 [Aphanomyces astaci]ETV64785.1 hypothetical protein H257_18384 [Aphanomyces astaci]|eukprot:XP_009845728.1 hypothetical protein H257_18384 [Aphanomyces astaci]